MIHKLRETDYDSATAWESNHIPSPEELRDKINEIVEALNGLLEEVQA